MRLTEVSAPWQVKYEVLGKLLRERGMLKQVRCCGQGNSALTLHLLCPCSMGVTLGPCRVGHLHT